jgi:hypothetical protein
VASSAAVAELVLLVVAALDVALLWPLDELPLDELPVDELPVDELPESDGVVVVAPAVGVGSPVVVGVVGSVVGVVVVGVVVGVVGFVVGVVVVGVVGLVVAGVVGGVVGFLVGVVVGSGSGEPRSGPSETPWTEPKTRVAWKSRLHRTGVSRTVRPVRGASTIMPLPAYIATWWMPRQLFE